ncbi:MAG TPA: hypothetical protein VF530_21650 [Planctomycetota bacterium]
MRSRWLAVAVVAGVVLGRDSSQASAPPQGSCGTPSVLALDEGSTRGSDPDLVALDPPVVGGEFDLAVRGGPPCSHGCLLWSPRETATFFRRYGATNFLAEPVLVGAFHLNASGDSPDLINRNVPALLCGMELVFQAFVIDPDARGGVAFTNGLRVHFGQR